MKKFKNKYRIPSARLKNWDYGANGSYFITICTENREHYFGNIENGIMQLNEIGILGEKFWIEIPEHFPFIELGNFIVMPNHVHGILIIDNVQTRLIASLPNNGGITRNKNPMFHQNISRIIRWYKGRCTFEMRKTNPNFKWQSRFHDHIIHNQLSFDRIQDYITNNALNWTENKFHRR